MEFQIENLFLLIVLRITGFNPISKIISLIIVCYLPGYEYQSSQSYLYWFILDIWSFLFFPSYYPFCNRLHVTLLPNIMPSEEINTFFIISIFLISIVFGKSLRRSNFCFVDSIVRFYPSFFTLQYNWYI